MYVNSAIDVLYAETKKNETRFLLFRLRARSGSVRPSRSRKPRTTADGQWFRFAFHLGNRRATICNPWFKFLVVLFAQEPAAAITGAHICDACVRLVRDAVKQCVHPPRFARARSTRPLDLFRRGRRGRDPPRRRRNDASRKDKYLWFKPSVLTSLRRAGTYRPWLP